MELRQLYHLELHPRARQSIVHHHPDQTPIAKQMDNSLPVDNIDVEWLLRGRSTTCMRPAMQFNSKVLG